MLDKSSETAPIHIDKFAYKVYFVLLNFNKMKIYLHVYTVNSRYLEVDWTMFNKFKLPEVQINLDL